MQNITISIDDWMLEQLDTNKKGNRSEYCRELMMKGLGIKPKVRT